MNLETPLYQKQIEAADKLWQHLKGWQLSDTALTALHERLPGFESHVCLLKCVAINAIYGTNVLAIKRMRKHVEEVLGKYDLSKVGSELVDKIAGAPEEKGKKIEDAPVLHQSFVISLSPPNVSLSTTTRLVMH